MTDEDVVHTCVSTRPIAWLRHVILGDSVG